MRPFLRSCQILATTLLLLNLSGCCCGPSWRLGNCLSSFCHHASHGSCRGGGGCGDCCDQTGGDNYSDANYESDSSIEDESHSATAYSEQEDGEQEDGEQEDGGSSEREPSPASYGSTSCKPGPVGWLRNEWSSRRWNGPRCDDVYVCSWISDPPEYCDPCNRCGHWTGAQCCPTNCWKDLFYKPLSRLSCKAARDSGGPGCGCASGCTDDTGVDENEGDYHSTIQDAEGDFSTAQFGPRQEDAKNNPYPETAQPTLIPTPRIAVLPKWLSAKRPGNAEVR